jgi:hypothetical protein
MDRRRVWRAPIATVMLLTLLCACSSTQYRNVTHPNYGDAEYKSDLAQCRSQNSKIVMSSGYDDKSEIKVDEAKLQACLAERGWQAVSR